MAALPGVLDQTGEVDQALWQADPSVRRSGTIAVQSQVHCCRARVVLGPLGHALLSPHTDSRDGGMHIPDWLL